MAKLAETCRKTYWIYGNNKNVLLYLTHRIMVKDFRYSNNNNNNNNKSIKTR